MFAEGFTAQQDLMENGSYDASNDETSRYVAEERLYAYGLFSAIALVQETITKPFVYDNFQKFRRDSTHPFIKGLETLNVSRLLRNKRCLKNIFISCETITLTQMVTCLDKQLSEDPDQAAKEMITFGHFVKFLQQVAGNFFILFTNKYIPSLITQIFLYCRRSGEVQARKSYGIKRCLQFRHWVTDFATVSRKPKNNRTLLECDRWRKTSASYVSDLLEYPYPLCL
jgi:hypothetical protein